VSLYLSTYACEAKACPSICRSYSVYMWSNIVSECRPKTRLVAAQKVQARVRARVRVQNPHPSPHSQFKKKNNFIIDFIYLCIYEWSPPSFLLTPDPTLTTLF
jgi:hypothetical protein